MDKFSPKPVADVIVRINILPYDEAKVQYMRDNIQYNCNCSKCRKDRNFISKVGI